MKYDEMISDVTVIETKDKKYGELESLLSHKYY